MERVFGIDLGTTYSVIAAVTENGSIEVINNMNSTPTTPSVVMLHESEGRIIKTVGIEAKNALESGDDEDVKFASFFKQYMGEQKTIVTFRDVDYSPEMLSSYVLAYLRQSAAQYYSIPIDEVKNVVITCPAYFEEAAKQATRAAGEIAGFNVLAVAPEPTMAAYSYGMMSVGSPRRILVFDLGGGTFDVTVLKVNGNGTIDEIARNGKKKLGGKDWDEVIIQDFYDNNPMTPQEADLQLHVLAEKAKIVLSVKDSAKIRLRMEDFSGKSEITRTKFEIDSKIKLDEAMELANRVVLEASLNTNDSNFSIDEVLLVGGSTRMPQVLNAIQHAFPNCKISQTDPDLAVAKGAAMYAQRLMKEGFTAGQKIIPNRIDPTAGTGIRQVSGKSYAVKVLVNGGPEMILDNIIKRNTPFPVEGTKDFSTAYPYQKSVLIELYENDYVENQFEVDETLKIGEMECPLAGTEKYSKIAIKVSLTLDGIITVTCFEYASHMEKEGVFHAKNVLSDDKLQSLISTFDENEISG